MSGLDPVRPQANLLRYLESGHSTLSYVSWTKFLAAAQAGVVIPDHDSTMYSQENPSKTCVVSKLNRTPRQSKRSGFPI
jgi:hypothetical protein